MALDSLIEVKNRADMILPRKSNLVNFSVLREIACPAAFRSFSIKYVCDGLEKYTVNGNTYYIKNGQYLLANHFAEGVVEIDKPVKGICIDVAPDLLSEVVATYLRPDTMMPDIGLDTFFTSADFLDNKYDAAHTNLGRFLTEFERKIAGEPDVPHTFDKTLYYHLAEKIVYDHIPVFRQLQSISKIKITTRKDLYRRVQTGKEYIDANFLLPLDIAEVAKHCNLSEYQFFRTFKQVFAITPYQYIIKKRLDFSKELILQGYKHISDVAYAAGFTDVFSFSKSFKKYTGTAPSRFKK